MMGEYAVLDGAGAIVAAVDHGVECKDMHWPAAVHVFDEDLLGLVGRHGTEELILHPSALATAVRVLADTLQVVIQLGIEE